VTPKKLRTLARWLEQLSENLFDQGRIDRGEVTNLAKIFDALNEYANRQEAENGK
jgi:hypothetical protein